jgi:glycolate oxidase FAD binding subunit
MNVSGAIPGTGADALLGRVPQWVFAPRTLEEARQFIDATHRESLSLAFLGGGMELDLGAPVQSLDAVLRTSHLSRVVEYVPADMIVTVEAGTTLAALAETLAQNRQRLALDPPAPERATVGGVIAANSFGPRRARFGSVRDLLIGISIIRADGTPARGGGKVVKNVAGFDLPKLMCGSLGTLGFIASATFRLHPLPEMERTVLVPSRNAAQVRALAARIKAGQLEPTSVVALAAAGGAFEVAVRFEGFAAGVNQQVARFSELERAAGEACEPLAGNEAQSWWSAHERTRSRGTLRAKIAALPSAIDAIWPHIDVVSKQLAGSSFSWYASLGIGFLCGTVSDATQSSRALAEARRRLEQIGGSLVLHSAPQAIRVSMGEWGTPSQAFPVMRRMKQRFDPRQRLNPGRFIGGL